MRNIAICSRDFKESIPIPVVIDTFELEGVPVYCGLVETPDISFDRQAPQNRDKVLVRVKAFSCNYRDKSLILKMAARGPAKSFYVVGSEFVAEVVDMGLGVDEFRAGDRVIGNGSYPQADVAGIPGGLPTNHGSKEYQVFHRAKLIKIPPEMPDDVAAAFPIGGQTVYSMIRKLALKPGENVLVTAAKSNTSLFALSALQQYPVNVYATSTSPAFEPELRALGVRQLFQVEPTLRSFAQHTEMVKLAAQTGGFDAVIDPFFDLHLGRVVEVMAPGGRYVTCGLYDQYSHLTGQSIHTPAWDGQRLMGLVMVKNLSILGNCIGQTDDLRRAIADYAQGRLPVKIDSVFANNQVVAFFERTYNARDRFGKVVYQYA